MKVGTSHDIYVDIVQQDQIIARDLSFWCQNLRRISLQNGVLCYQVYVGSLRILVVSVIFVQIVLQELHKELTLVGEK